MMRFNIKNISTSLVIIFTVLALGACEPKGPASRPQVPLPAPSEQATEPQYSYEHKSAISKADRQAIRAEYVIAVARVGDTTMIEESPFGDQVPVNQTGGQQVKVKVEAQGDTNITLKNQTEKKLRPQPTPRGFSQAARSQIIAYLQEDRHFTVVERESINDILREIEFGDSKWTDGGEESSRGLKGVRYIIKGDLAFNAQGIFGSEQNTDKRLPFVFRLRMYSVQTGVINAVGEGYGMTHDEALKHALDRLTAEVFRDYLDKKQPNNPAKGG
jgi:curli biogenesis system outer membrane secretion channel CsgG